MPKSYSRKYKKKVKYTQRKKYRLRKRSYKYSGGDVMSNLRQIFGIVNAQPTTPNPIVGDKPFLQ